MFKGVVAIKPFFLIHLTCMITQPPDTHPPDTQPPDTQSILLVGLTYT
jgi:hypothetical protein